MVGLVLCNVCKKKMLGFQRKCCQNFVKNPCYCFGCRLSYNHPHEVIIIGPEPYEIVIQIYRRDQEHIVALKLPNTGLNVSSGSSLVMIRFGYCYSVLAIS